PVAPTTAAQRLARKNELKARGTLLMALPDKHQLKFNIHKDAKSLMEAIKKRFGGNKKTKKKLISQLEIHDESLSQEDINLKFLRSLPTEWRTHTLIWRNKTDLEEKSLDDLFNSLKIYKSEVKSSSTSPTTQNIALVSSQNTDSTNESVSAIASVSAASTKVSVSALPNVDNLSDAVIYSFFASQSNSPQLHNDDLKQIDADDLEEMDLKWQMAMLTMRVRRFIQWTRRNLGSNGTTFIGFDMSKVKCYNCHRRGHFARECRKKFEKAKQERDELNLKLYKFQTSSKNLSTLLASQTTAKTGLGYDNQLFNSIVFDSDEFISFDLDFSLPSSLVYDRYQSGEGYHVVPPHYTRKFIPLKPDLVFHDAPTANETVPTILNIEPSSTGTFRPSRPAAPIIEDWSLTQKMNLKARCKYHQRERMVNGTNRSRVNHNTTTVPKAMLIRTGLKAVNSVRPVNLKRNLFKQINTAKEKVNTTRPNSVVLNAVRANKGKAVKASSCWVWRPIKLDSASIILKKHTYIDARGNISYLTDFKEFDGGYVAFKGGAKGGKITSKGTIRTGKLNFKDVYFVKELQFNLFSVSQMCDKKSSVLFTDIECFFMSHDFKLAD
nr:hypothetical protein [Tanacetum cinerariifolium]